MNKCRIVERTGVDGRVFYVIQQKMFLFSWVDREQFGTFEIAKHHLCYYDGSESKDTVIYENF